MSKYRFIVLLSFCLLTMCVGYVNASTKNVLKDKVIYIDPGHGGVDPGTIYKSIYEKDINLKISMELKDVLERNGAIVYLTRSDDYDLAVTNTINRKRSDLSRRVNAINKSNCDMYLSIHLNSEKTGTWRGPQVFYDDINENNKVIAGIIQKHLNKLFSTNREFKQVSDLYLEKRVKVPGVLVEVGFLSNKNDRYLLRQNSFVKKVSNSIVNALFEYFS